MNVGLNKRVNFSGGWSSFVRRDALLRVPILEMTRQLKIGDAQKRIPPSEVAVRPVRRWRRSR